MHLLHSNPLPNPEFVSLSIIVKPTSTDLDVNTIGEPLLLAAPNSTISYANATASLKELHKYLQSLLSSFASSNTKSTSQYERMISELMQEDEQQQLQEEDMIQVFRPLRAHGIGLHYKMIRDNKSIQQYSALILAASKAAAGADTTVRKIESELAGIVLTVGLSGLPMAYCSSSLQYTLSQRVSDCLEILNRIGPTDVMPAKTLLSTLLLTEDEARKTNEVADFGRVTAIPESGDDQSAGLGSLLSAKKSLSVINTTKRIATLGLLKSGDTAEAASIHIGLSSSSADLSRSVMQQMTVMSLAENDSNLRTYETSGQQRRANLDLAANKSRFGKGRKRKPDAAIIADLEHFDYKGPVKNTPTLVQRQSTLQSMSMDSSSTSASAAGRSNQGGSSSAALKPPSKAGARQTSSSRRNRGSVPALNAPRSDGMSSKRRGSNSSYRMVRI